MRARVVAVEYHLPDRVLTNAQLAAEFPEWTVEKIEAKTGILERRVSAEGECSSDLADKAARKLFASGACGPEEVDFLLLCTQSPDYFLPATACLLQARLGIPDRAGALDVNQGCSGFVYGLSLAKGLIETGQARTVLLLTAETYTKFIHPRDRSVRTIFGDGAAATLVRGVEGDEGGRGPLLGPFDFGTDGTGAGYLIVPRGGMRAPVTREPAPERTDADGNTRSEENLSMNGPEVFAFTLARVPGSVRQVLARAGRDISSVDLFVFHQANRFMLDHLRKKMGIPEDRFFLSFARAGNTVSSTIPIALREAQAQGRLRRGSTVLVSGFGVGFSWASALLEWGGA